MKLKLIEGNAVTLVCTGCTRTGTGGTEQYRSASRGDLCNPEYWYQQERNDNLDAPTPLNFDVYCATCAAKLSEQDPTRSVTQFYSDVDGTSVLPNV